ncbi:hypothetical protein FGO68_gene11016 [Halteria grandinella]|uniref:Uncharacterized protein n=1 Tax=Halteria grandinella TaxID=5974 RepID=A0A8J8NF03_HALGN|nr:hypothetical protein FGO68_gene11016 [Halteria grandinella]
MIRLKRSKGKFKRCKGLSATSTQTYLLQDQQLIHKLQDITAARQKLLHLREEVAYKEDVLKKKLAMV